MDNKEAYKYEYEEQIFNEMTSEEIAAIEKDYNIPSSQVPVSTTNTNYEFPHLGGMGKKQWKDIQIKWDRTAEENVKTKEEKLDNILTKVADHEDVNNAYEALKKITNKDNAVGALSVILAERLERLIAKKERCFGNIR